MKIIERILSLVLLSMIVMSTQTMEVVTKDALEVSLELPSKKTLLVAAAGIAGYRGLKLFVRKSADADLDKFYNRVQKAIESIIDDSRLMPSKLDSLYKDPFERRCSVAWQHIQHAFDKLVISLREKTSNVDDICIQLLPTLNTIASAIGSEYKIYLDFFGDMKNDVACAINHVDLQAAIVTATQALTNYNDQAIVEYRITKTKDMMLQCLRNDIIKAKSKICVGCLELCKVGSIALGKAMVRAYYRIMLQFCVR